MDALYLFYERQVGVMSMYVKVFLLDALGGLDQAFEYSVPAFLSSKVQAGKRVLVPFGKGGRKKSALIVEVASESEYDAKALKEILDVVDEFAVVTPAMLGLSLIHISRRKGSRRRAGRAWSCGW